MHNIWNEFIWDDSWKINCYYCHCSVDATNFTLALSEASTIHTTHMNMKLVHNHHIHCYDATQQLSLMFVLRCLNLIWYPFFIFLLSGLKFVRYLYIAVRSCSACNCNGKNRSNYWNNFSYRFCNFSYCRCLLIACSVQSQ